MTDSQFCSKSKSYSERKQSYRLRKLEMLKFIHDKLERRMAALQGAINKLQEQIDKSQEIISNFKTNKSSEIASSVLINSL